MLEDKIKLQEVCNALDGKIKKKIVPIGNDFIEQMAIKRSYCSECSAIIERGQTCLVSIRKGKVQKRICSEKCRQDFDSRFWLHKAALRSRNY